MKVHIISLNQRLSVETRALTIRTSHGQIQILEEHADLIAKLEPGKLRLESPRLLSGALLVGESGEVSVDSTALSIGFGYIKVEGSEVQLIVDRLLADVDSERAAAQKRLDELGDEAQLEGVQAREARVLQAFLAVD